MPDVYGSPVLADGPFLAVNAAFGWPSLDDLPRCMFMLGVHLRHREISKVTGPANLARQNDRTSGIPPGPATSHLLRVNKDD